MDKNIIKLANIMKTYRIPSIVPWKMTKKIKALDGVNFTCPQGKITCLLGPNGAGKTTIIKLIAGLITPDKGKIDMPGVKRGQIGLATPNERSFYWRLTGRQNLDFFASLYGLKGRERKKRVNEVLDEVGLSDEADKSFRLYSAGMKQKLILGRAILGNPGILLLDEPTTHIDPVTKRVIHTLITRNFVKKQGATILLCTHDVHEAQALADKLILLDNGRVIAQGSLTEIRKKMNPLLHVEIKCSRMPDREWLDRLSFHSIEQGEDQITIVVKDEHEIPGIVRSLVEYNGELLSCKVREDSLLDIIIRLTGGKAKE